MLPGDRVSAPVVDLHRTRSRGHYPGLVDHQPPARLIDLVGEHLDIGGELGPQHRRKYLPGTVADDLIQQRPATRRCRVVGLVALRDYLKHGGTFLSQRANADPDLNLSMGFDLAREVPTLHVTPPSVAHRF